MTLKIYVKTKPPKPALTVVTKDIVPKENVSVYLDSVVNIVKSNVMEF